MVRHAVVFSLFAVAAVSAAPAGSVYCEPPKDGSVETFVGKASGFIVGRVHSDKLLGNLRLDFQSDTDSKKKIHVEKVYTAASPKYNPRNELYNNFNRFTVVTDDCKFNWLLPKRLKDRINDFKGYLQQICFKHEDEKVTRVPLETLELKCSMRSTYKLAEEDLSKTAVLLRDLAENAQVANGSADVAKYSKATYSPTRENRIISRELQNNDGPCKYETLKEASLKDAAKAIASPGGDKEMSESVLALIKAKNVHSIVARVTTAGDSEACSRYYFHIFTNDEYFLELDYDTGD